MAKEKRQPLYLQQAPTHEQMFMNALAVATVQTGFEKARLTPQSEVLTHMDMLSEKANQDAAEVTTSLERDVQRVLKKREATISKLDTRTKEHLTQNLTADMEKFNPILKSQSAKWASLFAAKEGKGLSYSRHFDLITGKANEEKVREDFGHDENLVNFILSRNLSNKTLKRELAKELYASTSQKTKSVDTTQSALSLIPKQGATVDAQRSQRKRDQIKFVAQVAPAIVIGAIVLGIETKQDWAYDGLVSVAKAEENAHSLIISTRKGAADLMESHGLTINRPGETRSTSQVLYQAPEVASPSRQPLVEYKNPIVDNPPPEISFVPLPPAPRISAENSQGEASNGSQSTLRKNAEEKATQPVVETPPAEQIPTMPSTGGGGMAGKPSIWDKAKALFKFGNK